MNASIHVREIPRIIGKNTLSKEEWGWQVHVGALSQAGTSPSEKDAWRDARNAEMELKRRQS